jgi:hypothetical protein
LPEDSTVPLKVLLAQKGIGLQHLAHAACECVIDYYAFRDTLGSSAQVHRDAKRRAARYLLVRATEIKKGQKGQSGQKED